MKKRMNLFAVIISLCLAAACTAPESDEATTTAAKEETENAAGATYKADAEASRIEWIGTKVSGFHSGTVKIKSGEMTVSKGTVTGGTFVLNMSTIVATGPERVSENNNTKLTGHLLSADFFDVQKFPEVTFAITGVKPFPGKVNNVDDALKEHLKEYKVDDPTHSVSGNLTVTGITKNIEFPARIAVSGNAVEARARFNIDRKLWGIVYPGQPDDMIRDEIHIGIFLKAEK